MSKLTRFYHRIFGSGANSTQMAVFGSYKNGATQMTTDASTVASLANWLVGLPSGVVGKNSPLLEEVNGALFHTSRQVAYLLQQGIAEYNSETEYYIDSYVTTNNLVYRSIRDNHIGYPVTSLTTWKIFPDSALPSYATTTAYTTVRPLEEGIKFYNSTTKRFMSYLNSLWNYDDENTITPSYASTTAFVAARGGPVEGNKFYDTTLQAVRYYLGGVWGYNGEYSALNTDSTSSSGPSINDFYIRSSGVTLTSGRWKLSTQLYVAYGWVSGYAELAVSFVNGGKNNWIGETYYIKDARSESSNYRIANISTYVTVPTGTTYSVKIQGAHFGTGVNSLSISNASRFFVERFI